MQKYLIIFSFLLLSACSGLNIDRSYQAKGQDSRVQYIVLHYTAIDFDRSLYLLTQEQVSSHYLIDDRTAKIYQLVDENRRAWHAGVSAWQGKTFLNANSIGIEMVNKGFTEDAAGNKTWYSWNDQQIDQLIVLLKDIMQRHQLGKDSIIAHSDIAPLRKFDPGPLFPWKRLADEGLISWPDTQQVNALIPRFYQQPSALWFQQQLAKVGYQVEQHGEWDQETHQVLAAFQMKYRPQNFDGQPDAQTAALLYVLNQHKG